jgi:hypothetical protein
LYSIIKFRDSRYHRAAMDSITREVVWLVGRLLLDQLDLAHQKALLACPHLLLERDPQLVPCVCDLPAEDDQFRIEDVQNAGAGRPPACGWLAMMTFHSSSSSLATWNGAAGCQLRLLAEQSRQHGIAAAMHGRPGFPFDCPRREHGLEAAAVATNAGNAVRLNRNMTKVSGYPRNGRAAAGHR